MTSKFPEYNGLPYAQASNEAILLVQRAARSHEWLPIVDRLVELRRIMNDHFDKAL